MNTQQLIEATVVYESHPTAFKIFLSLLYMFTVAFIVFAVVMRKSFKNKNSSIRIICIPIVAVTYTILLFSLLATGVSHQNDR